jgi:hypothetical protein
MYGKIPIRPQCPVICVRGRRGRLLHAADLQCPHLLRHNPERVRSIGLRRRARRASSNRDARDLGVMPGVSVTPNPDMSASLLSPKWMPQMLVSCNFSTIFRRCTWSSHFPHSASTPSPAQFFRACTPENPFAHVRQSRATPLPLTARAHFPTVVLSAEGR